MSIHREFIETPLSSVLADAISALKCIPGSINAAPMKEYFLQALFLRMTGFQEQKLKCICWEIACDDYQYRYLKFSKGFGGECSSLDDKNNVLNDLFQAIISMDAAVSADVQNDREKIIAEATCVLNDVGDAVGRMGWDPRQYHECRALIPVFYPECLLVKSGSKIHLFGSCESCQRKKNVTTCWRTYGSLKEIFSESVYVHRNRCAHNTTAYQSNLPKLATLNSDKAIYANYFLRMFMLLLVDAVFVKLYGIYSGLRDSVARAENFRAE